MAPIHKEGSKGEAKNYIPVALISHVIKIFEKFVRKKIIEYLQKKRKTERFPTRLQKWTYNIVTAKSVHVRG